MASSSIPPRLTPSAPKGAEPHDRVEATRPNEPHDERPWWDKHRKALYAVAGVIVLLIIYHMIKAHYAAAGKKHGGQIPVAAVPAHAGDMPVYLDGLGSVTAYYTVTVHSRVDGQLMSFAVNEGQFVHAGDALAEIDPRPFQAQLDQAQGQLAKDQAVLTDAKLDLDRYQSLLSQNAIPKQQFDTQQATVGQAEGSVKSDQANVETANLQLTYAHITSPISGRVGLRQVDPGNLVHAADANGILVITKLQPITVIFTLPEDSLPAVLKKLHTGETLPVAAYNRDKSAKITDGQLQTTDNQIDPNTGTLKLKAVFKNDDNTLFPNQFVNIRLLLETRHNQILIPAVAIQRGSQGTFVYVVKPDNSVELRPVVAGITESDTVSIDSGVVAGENIVIDGADKLQNGSKVSLQTATGTTPTAAGAPAGAVDDGKKSRRGHKPPAT